MNQSHNHFHYLILYIFLNSKLLVSDLLKMINTTDLIREKRFIYFGAISHVNIIEMNEIKEFLENWAYWKWLIILSGWSFYRNDICHLNIFKFEWNLHNLLGSTRAGVLKLLMTSEWIGLSNPFWIGLSNMVPPPNGLDCLIWSHTPLHSQKWEMINIQLQLFYNILK